MGRFGGENTRLQVETFTVEILFSSVEVSTCRRYFGKVILGLLRAVWARQTCFGLKFGMGPATATIRGLRCDQFAYIPLARCVY
jgi:hypothetical protein